MADRTKEIKAIEEKYGCALLHMGLAHLLDVGARHLTNQHLEEGIKQIKADDESKRADGRTPFMTPEFQYQILRCAAELADYSLWDLFRYMQAHMDISK